MSLTTLAEQLPIVGSDSRTLGSWATMTRYELAPSTAVHARSGVRDTSVAAAAEDGEGPGGQLT